jgi:hypothetical protein
MAVIGSTPPVTEVRLEEYGRDLNGFEIKIPSHHGRVYRLEYKDDLADLEWFGLPLVVGTGNRLTLTDPGDSQGNHRFYRVRRW